MAIAIEHGDLSLIFPAISMVMFRSFVDVYQRVTYIEPSNIGKWGMFFWWIHHHMEKKSNGEDTIIVVLHSAPYCAKVGNNWANDWI